MQPSPTITRIEATLEPPASPGHPAAIVPLNLRHIVLAGFMGAGKTTVGQLLATRLGWSFLDLDAHLEARAGQTVPQLFEAHGEAHFRRLESTALASALAQPATVLALGGGTPESLTNRLLLEQTPGTLTVFLDAPFPTLFDRCMLDALHPSATPRPLLADPAKAEARFLARQPLYRRLARLTLDTASHPPSATVEALLEYLRSLPLPRG